MLRDWFSGAPAEAKTASTTNDADRAKAEKERAERQKRLDADPPAPQREKTLEEQEADRNSAIRRKLESARSSPRGPRQGPQGPTFEGFTRGFNRMFLEQCNAASFLHEGIEIGYSRSAHNANVSSKWSLGNQQSAGFELSLQLHGFSDLTQGSWSTQGRYSLMHQRMFRSGAVGVLQFMAAPQAAAMGGPPGTFFGMLQYPWVTGGTTQLSYLRGQHVQLNHAGALTRGLAVGANMSYDVTTRATTLSYAAHFQSQDRTSEMLATWNPDSGEWKIAALKYDWANDIELGTQLELAEKRQKMQPLLHVGLRKGLIGGGALSAVLTGFTRVKCVLELPFGGDKPNMNQMKLAYGVQYDAMSGGVKHGLTLSF